MGSFLNATAARWGTSRDNARRSRCWHCGVVLRWQNLIPVLSWVGQQGRCTSCYSRISVRYPVVELSTMIVFIVAGLTSATLTEIVFNIVVFSLMILILLIDFDQFIIPNQLSVPLALLSFAQLFISVVDLTPLYPSVWQLLAGPVLAIFFWLLWLVTGGRGMGFADGTLSLSIGWLLGLKLGITAVMVAFWVGTIVALGTMVYQRLTKQSSSLTLKSMVAFGPYLIVGFLLVYISKFSLFW